jgi:predicted DNA-binding protein (MmcQ/YjbR family)
LNPLDQITQYCLSFPATTETEKFGGVGCFCVDGKIFAAAYNQEGLSISFKVAEEDFLTLIEREQVIQAPYFARKQWVCVLKMNALSRIEWEAYLLKAYQLIVLKISLKRRKELGLA